MSKSQFEEDRLILKMSLIQQSGYNHKPWYYFNAHAETILPSLFNKVEGVNYSRERLELSDGDFVDLDWLKSDFKRLMIISHGMEGSTDRHYVKRPAKFFHKRGWDILAWNNRGCSGEINRNPRTYHHGEISDLTEVVQKGLDEGYDEIVLLGISMGGCQTLKYFGTQPDDSRILGGCTVSVSFSLRDTSIQAEKRLGGFYGKRFLKQHIQTLNRLADKHEIIRQIDLDQINSFDELHEKVTVKLFGYDDLEHFYYEASCINFINKINKPVLVLNAQNDPFLGSSCYPKKEIENHEFLYAEYPKIGGHVGFTIPNEEYSYIEYAAEKFINEIEM